MRNYKEELYKKVNILLSNKGINDDCYPLNAFSLASSFKNLEIKKISFVDLNVGGILLKGDFPTICVNSSKSDAEINFDCMHELMHLAFHKRHLNTVFSSKIISQNKFIEWEANEGAAEALAPYRLFIPLYCKLMHQLEERSIGYAEFIATLCKRFYIPEISVHIRIKSLDYEILQYLKGLPLEKIELISRTEKKYRGINVSEMYLPYRFEYAE